jgi:hypothetical protein
VAVTSVSKLEVGEFHRPGNNGGMFSRAFPTVRSKDKEPNFPCGKRAVSLMMQPSQQLAVGNVCHQGASSE